jgi:hypothetical protein
MAGLSVLENIDQALVPSNTVLQIFIIYSFIHSLICLKQVHNLFQSYLSTECDVVLPLPFSSILFLLRSSSSCLRLLPRLPILYYNTYLNNFNFLITIITISTYYNNFNFILNLSIIKNKIINIFKSQSLNTIICNFIVGKSYIKVSLELFSVWEFVW